jgi:DNA-binding NarL/FixJ family response regulator
MVRVLVVDDHELVRDTVSAVLRAHPRIDAVDICSSAYEALHLFRAERPDVVLMDLSMPGMGGAQATRELRAIDPTACVVVFTSARLSRDLDEAMSAGAVACVSKDADQAELVRTVIAAADRTLEPAGSVSGGAAATGSAPPQPPRAAPFGRHHGVVPARRWWRRHSG